MFLETVPSLSRKPQLRSSTFFASLIDVYSSYMLSPRGDCGFVGNPYIQKASQLDGFGEKQGEK
jgi:hypothetical protein